MTKPWASSDLHTPIFDEDHLEASSVIFLHRILKGFWEKLKVEIKDFQNLQKERNRVQTIEDAKKITRKVRLGKANWDALGSQYFDEVYRERFSQIKIKLPKELDVTLSFETGKIQAFYGGMDALFAFVNLVNGIPVDFFRQCKDEKCGRWFVLTSKHKRMFCNQLCAARYTERMKRERDPEKFRKYHRHFYQKFLKGTARSGK